METRSAARCAQEREKRRAEKIRKEEEERSREEKLRKEEEERSQEALTTRKRSNEALWNSAKKLRLREMEGRLLVRRGSFLPEHFRRIRLQETYEPIHWGVGDRLALDVDADPEVVSITNKEELIFVVAESGLCAVFTRASNHRLGILNQNLGEMVKMIGFNDLDASVLYVTTTGDVHRCSRAYLELLREGNFSHSEHVFGTLRRPYLKCTEERALVHASHDSRESYDIYDLNNYSPLFSILKHGDVRTIQPILSEGILFVWREKEDGETILSTLSIATGESLGKYSFPYNNIFCSCIVKDHLVIGVNNEFVRVVNMKTGRRRIVKSDLKKITCFKRLASNNDLLLAKKDQTYSVWDLGQKKEKMLCHGRCLRAGYNVIPVHNNTYILCYYKSEVLSKGAITVTHIRTGEIVAEISCNSHNPAEVLDSVCTMYYDEERAELYTGTNDGGFQIWSSVPRLG